MTSDICIDYDFLIIICNNIGICMYVLLVLIVEFVSGQFTGSESSGFIVVVVRITGGTSSTAINVTVTPSLQSPVSAMGM